MCALLCNLSFFLDYFVSYFRLVMSRKWVMILMTFDFQFLDYVAIFKL